MFAEQHPEYNITWDLGIMDLGEGGVIDNLKKDLDTAADVFLFQSGAIAELTEAQILYPITIQADEVMSIHGAGAIKSCTKDGLLYGVPETPNSWFMYYDKSKFSEEDVKSVEAMLAKDLGSGVSNFSCHFTDSWYMSAFFYANGGTLFGPNGDDPTECSWNDAKGLAVGQYLIDMNNNPKYVEDRDGLAGTMMQEGKLGALCSGTWSAEAIKTALGDNYAACKLPTINIDGTDYQLSNFADFKAIGVKSNTKHPKAAQELAVWLGGEECQLMRFEDSEVNAAPTVLSLIDNPKVQANPAIAALSAQTNYSTPQPSISKLNDYWVPAKAFGEGIFNGDITKDNLQENLDKMVENILATLTE
jgi:arabinogalactan oligomer/maltooligosaccharide transport system substrate-binding protein